MPRGDYAERHPTARARATVPRPPHTAAALGVPGEKRSVGARLGERGASERCPPGDELLDPGMAVDD